MHIIKSKEDTILEILSYPVFNTPKKLIINTFKRPIQIGYMTTDGHNNRRDCNV